MARRQSSVPSAPESFTTAKSMPVPASSKYPTASTSPAEFSVRARHSSPLFGAVPLSVRCQTLAPVTASNFATVKSRAAGFKGSFCTFTVYPQVTGLPTGSSTRADARPPPTEPTTSRLQSSVPLGPASLTTVRADATVPAANTLPAASTATASAMRKPKLPSEMTCRQSSLPVAPDSLITVKSGTPLASVIKPAAATSLTGSTATARASSSRLAPPSMTVLHISVPVSADSLISVKSLPACVPAFVVKPTPITSPLRSMVTAVAPLTA